MLEGRRKQDRENECRSCLGTGAVLLDAEYSYETGELEEEVTDCPLCRGAGVATPYRYPKPRSR